MRRILGFLLAAPLLLAPGLASAEVIQVPPGQTAADAVTSATVFKPGRRYVVKISGTVLSSVPGGSVSNPDLTYSAYHCLAGCPNPADSFGPHLDTFDAATGKGISLSGLNKTFDITPLSTYDAQGQYTVPIDYLLSELRISWFAVPFGRHPADNSGREITGAGFRVEITDITPKPCTAPAQAEPAGHFVSWVVKQGGPPKTHPDELTDTISVTRGVADLGPRDNGKTDYWDVRDPVGVVCHKDRFELEGHPTREEKITLGYRNARSKLSRNRRNDKRVELGIDVVASEDPDCKVGTVGYLALLDRRDGKRKPADAMGLNLGAGCAIHHHNYTRRGLEIDIRIEG